MLQTFLPQLMMTFFICLFILMMQFLWKYIDDIVGKGLTADVMAELFFHAALTLVPMAFPLAIMLASLMTFGNLGEHFELTALKSSGISLLKVMAPLIVLIACISVGSFFFQNEVLPKSQVKMWTLLFSARQQKPTLEIPEGTVYSQIPGYNIYVKHKNPETEKLYNVLIYDVSGSTTYPRIVSADSGALSFTPDYQHLVLDLYNGNWYEDVNGSADNGMSGKRMFRRESFKSKNILIPYDATFNRMDDQLMKDQYVGKNIAQLQATIDSLGLRVDSTGNQVYRELRTEPVLGVPLARYTVKDGKYVYEKVPEVQVKQQVNFDSLFKALPPDAKYSITSQARGAITAAKQNYEFKGFTLKDDQFVMRRHGIELLKKFTLSLACLIFFFIGAPLGAIIRKGGLGTPIVVSVIMFIFYYVVDTSGYKMARDGRIAVWQGIWLSSAVLLPLGIFLTQKAVNDSAVLNADAYANFFRRLLGRNDTRHLELKDVIIEEVNPEVAIGKIDAVQRVCDTFLQRYAQRQSYLDYWQNGYDRKMLEQVRVAINDLADYLSNSREQLVLNKAMDLPVIKSLWLYHPTNYPKVGLACAIAFPVGLPVYLVGVSQQKTLSGEVKTAKSVCDELRALLIPPQETDVADDSEKPHDNTDTDYSKYQPQQP